MIVRRTLTHLSLPLFVVAWPTFVGAQPASAVAKRTDVVSHGLTATLQVGGGVELGQGDPGGRFSGKIGYQFVRRSWSLSPHLWVDYFGRGAEVSGTRATWERLVAGGGARLERWFCVKPGAVHIGLFAEANLGYAREATPTIEDIGPRGAVVETEIGHKFAINIAVGNTVMFTRHLGIGPVIGFTKTTSDQPGVFSWAVQFKGLLPI